MKKSNIKNAAINLRYLIKKNLLRQYKAKGYKYINKPLSEKEYEMIILEIYGNQYLDSKYHDFESQKPAKDWLVDLVLNNLKNINKVLDAGANRGYLMHSFMSRGIDAYGFDILEDKSRVLPECRNNFKLGSILNIPEFNINFDLVTCIDVFEHIPINYIDLMAEELIKLKSKYLVFQISNDVISDGHITIKPSSFWIKKFTRGGYRLMNELQDKLETTLTHDKSELYINIGVPRNNFNAVPGILFFECMDL